MASRNRLRRTKGWRKPEGTVVVARPSQWGNPFRLGVHGDAAGCVELYTKALWAGELGFDAADVRRLLQGRDLACWCHEENPCHADVLRAVALDSPEWEQSVRRDSPVRPEMPAPAQRRLPRPSNRRPGDQLATRRWASLARDKPDPDGSKPLGIRHTGDMEISK